MSDQPTPQHQSDEHFQKIVEFLRGENEAHRAASREEAASVRELLMSSIKIVAYPVTAAIAIFGLLLAFAGWMGLRSLGDIKTSIKAEGERVLLEQSNGIQRDVETRLNEEFAQEKIKQTIREAARVATATEARPLIKSEVSRQVAVEQRSIKRLAESQFENELYRIRDIRVRMEFVLSDTLNSPERFMTFHPSVYFSGKGANNHAY